MASFTGRCTRSALRSRTQTALKSRTGIHEQFDDQRNNPRLVLIGGAGLLLFVVFLSSWGAGSDNFVASTARSVGALPPKSDTSSNLASKGLALGLLGVAALWYNGNLALPSVLQKEDGSWQSTCLSALYYSAVPLFLGAGFLSYYVLGDNADVVPNTGDLATNVESNGGENAASGPAARNHHQTGGATGETSDNDCMWTCGACTFENSGTTTSCEMCAARKGTTKAGFDQTIESGGNKAKPPARKGDIRSTKELFADVSHKDLDELNERLDNAARERQRRKTDEGNLRKTLKDAEAQLRRVPKPATTIPARPERHTQRLNARDERKNTLSRQKEAANDDDTTKECSNCGGTGIVWGVMNCSVCGGKGYTGECKNPRKCTHGSRGWYCTDPHCARSAEHYHGWNCWESRTACWLCGRSRDYANSDSARPKHPIQRPKVRAEGKKKAASVANTQPAAGNPNPAT